MKREEFKIGSEFWCGEKQWRCTDIGTRVIVAVTLGAFPKDASWLNGPPYAVAEFVFDEDDIGGCSPADKQGAL